MKNLPDLIKMRAALKSDKVKDLDARCGVLRRRIAGYQNAMGAGSTMEMQMGVVGGGDAILQQ